MEYKDLLGQEIKVGDTFAFAYRSGNVGSMAIRQVKELTTYNISYSNKIVPAVKTVQGGTIRNLENIIVLPKSLVDKITKISYA